MIAQTVGVVVIGRNEGERLIRCLTSIKCEPYNVVYVDSGSTDGSILAATKNGAHVIRLDLTRPFTAARARNEGLAALMEINPNVHFVQFIDGDCTLASGWLDKALGFMELRNDVAVACGRRRELYPNASIYNHLCDIEWDTPIGDTLSCGGDALVRIEAFEAVGGFRTQLIAGEEPELCVRLRKAGWKIWRLDAEMTGHDAAMTHVSQFWARAIRSGHAYAEVSRLHKGSPYGIWRRETLRAICWGGLLPTICLGALIHPAAIAAAGLYPLQICRIALTRGPSTSRAWIYASLITMAKFAEFQGVLRFYKNLITRRKAELIEYK